MHTIPRGKAIGLLYLFLSPLAPAFAQNPQPPPAPSGAVTAPGTVTPAGFVPAPILQGGEVFLLYPPGSPFLKQDRVNEPEQHNMTSGVPGRIQSIVNIHNPSIELHRVERGTNTGAAVILIAGGGHNTLNVGTEGADFVSYFYQYGVTTIILRSRLRRDGYNAQTDEVYDAQQAVRMVRARAQEWGIDANKIGLMGFSAGAELVAPAAVFYEKFDQANSAPADPLRAVRSRPDFAVLIYPGPTPFARDPNTAIPRDAPPSFIASAGTGDAIHAQWADEYFSAFLKARIPNLEMHLYGNGVHGNGLKDRDGTPFGTWPNRFVDWFRDLGFLGKPGVETKAAKDVKIRVAAPAPTPRP
ncbi:MAG TPA: alpha/beta hydrolase [Vicinamibacterales bacterium]|jgi:acetyl esterase/lipase|nr:alpha/beta hydrolase [Vicinamibacterales bacterium]